MNVIFHAASGLGLFTRVQYSKQSFLPRALVLFFGGIICHGILDYIPHCYPLSAKWDILISTVVMAVALYLTKPHHRLLLCISFLGNIFPDLVDLGPAMVNKYLHLNLPIMQKIFPWHWKQYSGSIYDDNCGVSHVNHLLVILVVAIAVIYNWLDIDKTKHQQYDKQD